MSLAQVVREEGWAVTKEMKEMNNEHSKSLVGRHKEFTSVEDIKS